MERRKWVVFLVEKEEYAIEVSHVISIERMEQLTPIPQLPNYVKGIMNVRDDLVPVVDLRQVLYEKEEVLNETVRVIVLKTKHMPMALLVKEAKELIETDEENVKQVGLINYKQTSFFEHVIQMNDRLITVIDPNQLIESLDGIREIYDYMEERKKESVVE
ncbi:chemotaxis protein CheW [Fervidibacillus halotolerans]|uniref:Chemotaxis protein CheW n=1 Tax=Fervidibacillus halotolerans TaxID=2980027 RepID=A0A9E8M1T7_9BACI|nr:chemotaxis protein CheW [Fervidibacillus halotolerans]WAA13842.1 chemotaxis protein CheW [Fervidibacillus halotolerans]